MNKDIILYSLSAAINKGSILLFFPLLTQFLTLENFGKWSLIIIVSNLLIPIISLNGSASILREGSNNLKIGFSLFKKYIYFSLLIGIFSGCIVYFFVGTNWFFYSVLIGSAEALLILSMTYVRTEDRVFNYFLISFFKTLILFFIILYAKNSNLPLDILLTYHFITVIIFALTIAMFLFIRNKTNNSQYELISALLFGIALIPHGLSQWIMSSADRLILEYMLGSTSVGIYSLAYNIALILMLLNSGIALALPPYLIKNFNYWKDKEYDTKLSNYYTILSILLFLIVLIIYYLDKNYFHVLGYYGPEMIPLIITIYSSIYILGLYYFYVNYLFYYKKAIIISKVTFYAALLNIILTILFVYISGTLGAAVATLFAYIYYLYKIRQETLKYEPLINISLFKNIGLFVLFVSIISLSLNYLP